DGVNRTPRSRVYHITRISFYSLSLHDALPILNHYFAYTTKHTIRSHAMRALVISAAVAGAVALTGCQSTGNNLGGVEYDKAALRSEERRVGKECSCRR